jgi:hypothetical protein
MPTYDDWRAKVKPLGEKRLRLPFNERVSEEEAARAKSGLLPESMDDKWAGFWLESEVAFCRSWTGQQIYSLPIKKSGSGYEVGPLEVLDDLAAYRRSSDEMDVSLASRLLARLTKRNEKTA